MSCPHQEETTRWRRRTRLGQRKMMSGHNDQPLMEMLEAVDEEDGTNKEEPMMDKTALQVCPVDVLFRCWSCLVKKRLKELLLLSCPSDVS